MKKLLTIAGTALLGGLAVVGCQSHHHSASQVLNSQQVKQAESIVSHCLTEHPGNFKAVKNCLAPGGPMAKVRFESCAARALPYITNKTKFEGALTQCVLKDR